MKRYFLFFAALLAAASVFSQSSLPTVVQHTVDGNKVYLDINAHALQQVLDTFAVAMSAENNTWSSILANGSNPGMDVDFNGYDITGLGALTSSETLTADSLVLQKDASIAGRLQLTGVANLGDSLHVSGFVEFADSLQVVRAVTVGETLFVSGVTSLGDSLHVASNVDFDALFNVDGAVSFGSTLFVSGNTTLNDSLLVSESVVVSGTLIADSIRAIDVIQGEVSSLGNHDTDDLSEGTANLYYTDARAQAAITAGTGVTVTNGAVAIGQAVGTSDDVTFNTVTADLTGNVTGTVSDVSNHDTDDLSEGTANLYYTDARAQAAITAGIGVTVTNGAVAIGQAVGTSDDVTFNTVTADLTGDVTGTVSDVSNHDTDDLSEGATNLYYTDARAQAAITAGTGVTVTNGAVAIGQAVGTSDDVTFNGLLADSVVASAHLDVLGQIAVADTAMLSGFTFIDANASITGTLNASQIAHEASIDLRVPNIGSTYYPNFKMYEDAGFSTMKSWADEYRVYSSDRLRMSLDGSDNYLDIQDDNAGLDFLWISDPGLETGFDMVELKGASGMTLHVGTGQKEAGIEMTSFNDLMVIYADTLFQPISEAMMIQIDSDESTDYNPIFGGQDHLYMTDNLNGNTAVFQHLTTYDELFGSGNMVSLFGSNDLVITADNDAGIELSDHYNTAVIYGDSLTLKGDTRVVDNLMVDGIMSVAGGLVVDTLDLLAVIVDLMARIDALENPGFSCGSEAIDYDGNAYSTVQIGEQCWFAENLKVTHYVNGDAISYLPGDADWNNTSSTSQGAYCYYDNNAANAADYGALYNWYASADERGLCPSGWHVPTSTEISALYSAMGSGTAVGLALKASPSDTPAWNGANTSGFTALPAGYREVFGSVIYTGLGSHNYLWTSTETASWEGQVGRIQSNDYCNIVGTFKKLGAIVRCLRD